jgi:hypothetical protein
MFFALTRFLGQMKPTKRSLARADGPAHMWEESRDRCSIGGPAFDTAHFGGLLLPGMQAMGFGIARFAG